jgi:hypothetical protein
MAQKVQVLFTDDLDGSEAEGTVRFGLDGADYEIDLSTTNAAKLRESLGQYIKAGRKVSSAAKRTTRATSNRAKSDGPSPSEIREWAASQGIEVSNRGRIPNDLLVKFQAANA